MDVFNVAKDLVPSDGWPMISVVHGLRKRVRSPANRAPIGLAEPLRTTQDDSIRVLANGPDNLPYWFPDRYTPNDHIPGQ
jgi:hypothetical protein